MAALASSVPRLASRRTSVNHRLAVQILHIRDRAHRALPGLPEPAQNKELRAPDHARAILRDKRAKRRKNTPLNRKSLIEEVDGRKIRTYIFRIIACPTIVGLTPFYILDRFIAGQTSRTDRQLAGRDMAPG